MNTKNTHAPDAEPKKIAPYGSWASPINAELLSSATVGLSEIRIDGNCIYWLESRPQEKGRTAIVQYRDGKCRDVLPKPLSARSKVNEYGGGSYCVNNGTIYFVLFDDQRIYRLDTHAESASPEAITPENRKRFGDLQFDATRNRLIAVCEDHTNEGHEPESYLVAINLDQINNNITTLHQGADFYGHPRISPNGNQLTWVCWNHPNMPWDNSECWLANLDHDGELDNPRSVAGGTNESIIQPQFSPDNILYFVSDRTNWWNIYRYDQEAASDICIQEKEAEFAGPPWVFGESHYSFLNADTIVGTYTHQGLWRLYQLDIKSKQLKEIVNPCCDIAYVQIYQNSAVFVGSSPLSFDAIYQLNDNVVSCLKAPTKQSLNSENLSQPQSILFPLRSRQNQKRKHGQAFYYPPNNKTFSGPSDTAPPLLVFCHGGPTAETHSSLSLKIQYWTSRGIAVVDINYGGSTGFGRDYRESLQLQWGVIDVEDCVDCVNTLVERGLADTNKVAIRGGSAGGYTVLCALTFHNVFKAGASHYGIGDLETLATDTHKFESRYLDSMVGPYPQQKSLYQQRSPINHLDQLNCPVIFFQGLQDKVVPPNQAQAMVDALDEKAIPHAYVTFEEEGHGFRQAANQRRAIESELYFYSQVFGFKLAEPVQEVTIKHLHFQPLHSEPLDIKQEENL